jgi:hypothetical protein
MKEPKKASGLEMYKMAEPKKTKDLPLAKIRMGSLKKAAAKKKIRKAKGKIDPEKLPEGGKGGALKALDYNRKKYLESDKSPERKKQLKEQLEFYKKYHQKAK